MRERDKNSLMKEEKKNQSLETSKKPVFRYFHYKKKKANIFVG